MSKLASILCRSNDRVSNDSFTSQGLAFWTPPFRLLAQALTEPRRNTADGHPPKAFTRGIGDRE